jgi:Flp pilus assembly CpaE family ATPase
MEDVARVVLALEQHDVAEEVMHFLDRSGRARVVATAVDDRQLAEAVRQLEPDAVVAQPSLAASTPLLGRTFLAVDTRETVASLRAALAAGARGFYLWPADREALAGAAAATVDVPAELERRALVVAVRSARGGAGVTFVATHLARSFARRGDACILIDAAPLFGDVAAALGVPIGADGSTTARDDGDEAAPSVGGGVGLAPSSPGEDVRTLGDLLPVVDELAPRHLEHVLWTHPQGFRVLLAPPPKEAAIVSGEDLRVVATVAASVAEVVVLHLPRSLDALSREATATADRIVEILTLDVLSFRAATRVLEALKPDRLDQRVGFVVNRAARAEIAPSDVARVFGQKPLAVLPFDRTVQRLQDRGRLLPVRGRTTRAVDRLAHRLHEEVS